MSKDAKTATLSILGFKYVRVGDIRQLTFCNRLLFASCGRYWKVCWFDKAYRQ